MKKLPLLSLIFLIMGCQTNYDSELEVTLPTDPSESAKQEQVLKDAYSTEKVFAKVQLGECEFDVEIADTDSKKMLGLQYRKELGSNRGMLFDYRKSPLLSNGKVGFYMPNMNFALDILFFDKDQKLVNFYSAIPENPPYTYYKPNKDSIYVLEILAGSAKECKLNAGDELVILEK